MRVDGPGADGLWRHLGLTFSSPYPLGRSIGADCVDGAIDVVVRPGPARPVGTKVPGSLVAELSGARVLYSIYEDGDGYLARFNGVGEFRVSGNAGEVVCCPSPEDVAGLAPLLLAGTVTALLLALRGLAVLHGSAVRWQDTTVLFAGPSGYGKSTLAALCCAAGAALVTDDVVPLQAGGKGAVCVGLGDQLRLREAATEIAALGALASSPRRPTVDGRLAVGPPMAAGERNVVSVVVLPRPDRGASEVRLARLAPTDAVTRLLGNTRLPALAPVTLQRGHFELLAGLVAAVPVVEAWVPWGPPFGMDVAAKLMAALSELSSASTSARA